MYRIKPQVNMTYLSADNIKIDARLRCRDKGNSAEKDPQQGKLKPAAKPLVKVW